jgi:arylsulfatase A-like enzyme
MGCLGPGGGPMYNLPQETPCATGPNTAPNAGGPSALALYNSTLQCGDASAPNCNAQIVQQPLTENELDRNYAAYARNFIQGHAAPGSPPFFMYMAFSHTHVPLFFDPKFANSSARKTIFADTTMELDDTVNQIWQAVKDAGVENDTLILMTSDNGPWAVKCDLAGSAGPFTGEYQKKLGGGSTLKDTTWEGGQRVMGLAHWPGHISPRVSNATVSSLDYLPTILALAGVPLPADRSFDGVDLAPLLFGGADKVRDFLFMSDTIDKRGNVTSVRYLNYKAYSRTYSQDSCKESSAPAVDHPDYLVFDLDADPSESTPIRPPQAVLDAIYAAHAAKLLDIETTMRGNTSYATGATMIGSAPCCNASNIQCRCTPN